jgi:hypothetical protein
MRKSITPIESAVANSYIENLNFFFDLTEITINTTIDLIKLSATGCNFTLIDKEMRNHFKVCSGYRLPAGKFERKIIYGNDHGTIDLFYKPKAKNAYMRYRFLFLLHQPNREMMAQLDYIFRRLGIYPLVSKIELAWDFYGVSVWCLMEFLRRHLFLKYQRSPAKRFKNTYYTNDIRRSVKGVRLYPRPIDSEYKDVVRLELEIHRPKIRELRIAFPIRAVDLDLDLDFSKFFEFRKMDWKKFIAYIVKKNWKQIGMLNYKRPGCGDLVLRQIESSCTTWADMPLMSTVEDLRTKPYGIQNFSRFFVPMGNLNMMIEDAAYKQRFQLS